MIFIGELVKLKRIEMNLTQENLADLLSFTNSQISKIEKGKSGILPEVLYQLSYILNFDFIKISKYTYIFENYDDYCTYFKLKDVIAAADNNKIRQFLETHTINLTNKKDDMYYAYQYANAIVTLDKDPFESVLICMEALDLTDKSLNDLVLTPYIHDDKLAIYTTLSVALSIDKENNTYFILAEKLYEYFTTYLFNDNNNSFVEQSFFVKKFYIIIMNNLAHFNFASGNYIKAILLCNTALSIANNLGILKFSNRILKLKMESLYLNGEIEEAKKYYIQALTLSQIMNEDKYCTHLMSVVENNYPEILK